MIEFKKLMKRVVTTSALMVLTTTMFAPSVGFAEDECSSDEYYSSFTVDLPDYDIMGEMQGKKINIYGDDYLKNALREGKKKIVTLDNAFMKAGKTVAFSEGVSIDVANIANAYELYSHSEKNSDRVSCLTKDNADLIKENENRFSNIRIALRKEITYSEKIKDFIVENIDFGKYRLDETEKIIFSEGNAASAENNQYLLYKKAIQEYFNNMTKEEAEKLAEYMEPHSPLYYTTSKDYQILAYGNVDTFEKAEKNKDDMENKYDNGTLNDTPLFSGKLVAAPGMFTSGYFLASSASCNDVVLNAQDIRNQKFGNKDAISDSNATNINRKDYIDGESSTTKTMKGLLEDVQGGFTDATVEDDGTVNYNDDTLLGLNCAEIGVVSALTQLYTPVNITTSKVVMDLIFTFQVVAIGMSVLLLSVFGLYYATGNEATNPYAFLIRGFIVLFIVYWFPYFIQDILNINNMLVHFIQYTGVDPHNSETYSSLAIITLIMSISALIANFGVVVSLTGVGVLFLVLLVLVVVVFFVKAIATLYIWWVMRFLMIIFLAVLGPLFVVMMMLPKTAHYGYTWLKSFIAEVMTQSIIVIGVYFGSKLLEDLTTLKEDFGLNIIGQTIFVYAIILLISRMPEFSSKVFGGGLNSIVGIQDAKQIGESVGQFVNNAGMAIFSSVANAKRLSDAENLRAGQEEYSNEVEKLEQSRASGEITQDTFEKRQKDLDERKRELDDRRMKVQKQEKSQQVRKAFASTFQSGKLTDDGLAKKAMSETKRMEEDDDRLKDAADTYDAETQQSDEDTIKKKYDNEEKNMKNKFSIAALKYSEKKAKINNSDASEEEKKEQMKLARAELKKSISNAKSDFNEKSERILGGYKTVKEASREKKRKAEENLHKNISKTVGKGDFISESDKEAHVSSIANKIRNDVHSNKNKGKAEEAEVVAPGNTANEKPNELITNDNEAKSHDNIEKNPIIAPEQTLEGTLVEEEQNAIKEAGVNNRLGNESYNREKELQDNLNLIQYQAGKGNVEQPASKIQTIATANGIEDAQRKTFEMVSIVAEKGYNDEKGVNYLFNRVEGLNNTEAQNKTNETTRSFEQFKNGQNLNPHTVTANHSLEMVRGAGATEAIGQHYEQNDIGTEWEVASSVKENAEEAYGKNTSSVLIEDVKVMSEKTIAASEYERINQIHEVNLQTSIDNGAISYDKESGQISGQDFDVHVDAIKKGLMEDAGFSERKASLVAEQYVRTSVIKGNSDIVGQLPNEAASAILTEFKKGEMSREQVVDTFDTMSGHNESVGKMVEDYISQLEKNLGGEWNVIKGDGDIDKI